MSWRKRVGAISKVCFGGKGANQAIMCAKPQVGFPDSMPRDDPFGQAYKNSREWQGGDPRSEKCPPALHLSRSRKIPMPIP